MKILRWFLFILGGILLFGVFLSLFLVRTFNTQKFLSEITPRISEAVGRDVSIGRLELSLFPSLGFRLKDVVVRDDPAFSDGDLLTIAAVEASLELGKLLRERKFVVGQVLIEAPQVFLVRSAQGALNLPASSSEGSGQPGSQGGAVAAPAFLVREVAVRHGGIILRDLSCQPACVIPIEDISVMVQDFSPGRPFDVKAQARFFAQGTNLSLSSRVTLSPSLSLEADLEVSSVNAEALSRALPFPATLRGLLSGKVSAVWTPGTDPLDHMTLHMTGGLTQGVIVMDRIGDMLSERTLLAGLWPVVLETLPPDVRAQWEKGEVPVEEAVLDVRLKEGVVFLEKVSVVSADMAFDLTGDGRLSGALQGRGGLVLSDRLTQEVLKKDAVFQGICNKAQRIEIPFVLEGTLSQPQLRPDAESVAKKLLVEKGRQGLSSLLEKDPKVGGVVDILFGGDSRRETTEGSTEEGPAPSSGGSSGQADRLSEGLGVLLQKVLGQ